MNKKIVLSFIGALALFSGCGGSSGKSDGGSSNSPGDSVSIGTGYYIDSAVAGVEYKCGKESGVTASDGKFTFEKGKDCSFNVAGVEIRKVEATKLVDKVKIVEDKPEVAAFLQSIDIDGNPSNGIDIKPEVLKVLKEALKNHTTVPTDDNLTNVVNEVKNSVTEFKGEVVTREKAMQHVKGSQESVVKELLGGKTFYVVGQDEDGGSYIGEIKFNQDVTQDNWKDLTEIMKGLDDGESGRDDIIIDGNTLVFSKGTSDENSRIYLYKTNNYLVFSRHKHKKYDRLYYNKAKAEAYYKSLKNDSSSSDGGSASNDHIAITQAMLDGKTFYTSYIVTEENYTVYEKYSFSNGEMNGLKIKVQNGVVIEQKEKTFTYTLENGYIRYTTDKEVGHIVLKSKDSNTWHARFQAIDDPSNGTDVVLYLTKPANFPSAL